MQFQNRVVLIMLALFLMPQTAHADRETFDLTRLQPIQDEGYLSVEERLKQGVAFLQEELANPSRAKGPIDTSYVQSVMIGVLKFPGAIAPKLLRKYRDESSDPRLKDRLTIALAFTGAEDTIPDLMRIARKDSEGHIRGAADYALWEFLKPPASTDVPPRLRPGETWKPLDEKTRLAMAETFMAGLQDTFKHYLGIAKEVSGAVYPIQSVCRGSLRNMGYEVASVPKGWRVYDPLGRPIRLIPVKEKMDVRPRDPRRDGSDGIE